MKMLNFIYTLLISTLLFSTVANAGVHLDKNNLPLGCATCHYKTSLKGGGGSEGCIVCHGDPQRRKGSKRMPAGAVVVKADMKNIEAEFFKTFRHPTFDTPGRHRPTEVLPEIDTKALRHADCVDCHHPHYVTRENLFAGLKGKRIVNQVTQVSRESEVCYRCHGDSLNLPGRYTNKRIEFSLTNPSFHPVEGEGKSSTVISLLKPYKEKKISSSDVSVITCGDCHGNDDSNGPKGVHGSRYRYILKDNFDTIDGASESSYAYALCYRCHSRTSILADESFRYHSLHIQGRSIKNPGTSCFTCHNSHGSVEFKYLIKFNRNVVSPNSKGLLKFVEKGNAKFSGECYLTCHGVEHNPKSY
ncbi:MAG: cytochrome C [Geobacteraceae bacterium]|nr:cytochrome C [Geobacteraceae bacterium]